MACQPAISTSAVRRQEAGEATSSHAMRLGALTIVKDVDIELIGRHSAPPSICASWISLS
jgi:hypothetical protein